MKIYTILIVTFTILNANFLDSANEVFNKIKEKVTFSTQKDDSIDKEERFSEIWLNIKDKLVEGSKLYEKKEKAPNSTLFFTKDKDDYQDKIDDVLNDIIKALVNDNLLKYKEDIAKIDKEIKRKEEKLAEYKEERVGAPTKSAIHKTKADYDKKIKNTQDEIAILKNKKEIIYNKLKRDFKNIGVNLDSKQIDILLDRVDGDDIIQMSLIMDVLKQITAQILELMRDSDEDLIQAKRYYGMHLVSLALVVHIEQKYIEKLDNIYIPKLDELIKKSQDIIYQTQIAIDKESSPSRRRVYESNLEAQQLTLKVAKLYKKHLLEAKNSVLKAQESAKKNLALAENTYSTVSLSSSLYNLIKENEAMLTKISQIQMPNIVPFENIQIERKYKELTKKMLEE